MTNKDFINIRFMKDAFNEAMYGISYNHGGPFGCVIVKDNKIIGRGHNRVLVDKDPTRYGEIVAIQDACRNLDTYDLSGCELYTTSEPCLMSYCAIQSAKISKIYYGCTLKDTESLGFINHQVPNNVIPSEEICRANCEQIFEAYSMSDHIIY